VHVGRRTHEVLKPVQGIGVGPLQVVDDEDEGSGRSEYLRERLEEP
jgi:hypothetical protein